MPESVLVPDLRGGEVRSAEVTRESDLSAFNVTVRGCFDRFVRGEMFPQVGLPAELLAAVVALEHFFGTGRGQVWGTGPVGLLGAVIEQPRAVRGADVHLKAFLRGRVPLVQRRVLGSPVHQVAVRC